MTWMSIRCIVPSGLLLCLLATGCARIGWATERADTWTSPPFDAAVTDGDGSPSADIPVACDDGHSCTHSDHLVAGTCTGTSYTCDDGDTCTHDTCNGDGTCSSVPLAECTIGYGTSIAHPSSGITYSGNRIKLNRIVRRANGGLSLELISDMGSFKDSPQYWDVWYSYSNPPPLCHDGQVIYAGTVFEGLRESVLAATFKNGLTQKLTQGSSATYTYKWASNTKGGDLCQSGNFWTVIKFTTAGVSHVASLLKGSP